MLDSSEWAPGAASGSSVCLMDSSFMYFVHLYSVLYVVKAIYRLSRLHLDAV